jgi:hypothetical protein
MPEPKLHTSTGLIQRRGALILRTDHFSADDRSLTQILDFFGIPWWTLAMDDAGQDVPLPGWDFCVLSSAERMAQLKRRATTATHKGLPQWLGRASSACVYGFRPTTECQELLRFLTGDPQAGVRDLRGRQTLVSVTGDFPGMCGPMSRMSLQVHATEGCSVCDVAHRGQGFQPIVTADGGVTFFTARCEGVPYYLSTFPRIVDLSLPSVGYFDVRKWFFHSVPLAMYLKWAFGDVCWRSAERSACLIVDDPPLKARYGFMDFRETVAAMQTGGFTTSIGFIPWNWRRTDPGTVNLIRSHSDKLSVAVHGCDHVAGEFAPQSTALLNAKAKCANQRMDSLARRMSLDYDRVMIFPQGAFSPEAGHVLKLNGFTGAVNTRVAPSDETENQTTVRDLWDIAIMKYGMFPIFTRRYLWQGIENFAFDVMLGKPCFIAAHHDIFKDRGRELTGFVETLRSRAWNMRWRPLGEAVGHSFKVRRLAEGVTAIRMYAPDLVLENQGSEPQLAVFDKQEDSPDCVRGVTANQVLVDFAANGGYLHFEVMLPPMQALRVRVAYRNTLTSCSSKEPFSYHMKARARRHLSEFRDNYLSKNSALLESANRLRRVLSGARGTT